jgi:hypothetical protein
MSVIKLGITFSVSECWLMDIYGKAVISRLNCGPDHMKVSVLYESLAGFPGPVRHAFDHA